MRRNPARLGQCLVYGAVYDSPTFRICPETSAEIRGRAGRLDKNECVTGEFPFQSGIVRRLAGRRRSRVRSSSSGPVLTPKPCRNTLASLIHFHTTDKALLGDLLTVSPSRRCQKDIDSSQSPSRRFRRDDLVDAANANVRLRCDLGTLPSSLA